MNRFDAFAGSLGIRLEQERRVGNIDGCKPCISGKSF